MRFPNRAALSLLLPVLMGGVTTTALIATPHGAKADTAPTKSDAQALYNKLGAALKKKDTKAIQALAVPNATNQTADGKTLTRDQWISSLDANLKGLTTINSATFTVTGVKMVGANMVVDNSLHLVATIADPKGKPHKMDAISKAQDTWTKSGGKWLLLLQKDIPAGGKMLIDGKAFPPAPSK